MGATLSVKWAVTVFDASMVTVQVPVPEHPPPDQPVKIDPDGASVVAREGNECARYVAANAIPPTVDAGRAAC